MPHAPKSFDRRRLLTAGAASVAALGTASWHGRVLAQTPPKPLPAYVSWKDADRLIVHSNTTIETKRTAFGSEPLTPADRLYIRNNLPAPDAAIVADRDAWTVAIEGVKEPRTLTVAQLKAMGTEQLTMVLQCSGNGRGFFPNKPSGTPWTVGAAGCVQWEGVPLRKVVASLGGVADGMRFLTGTGGEKLPEGIDPRTIVVERSVPVAAMADAMLAWQMNGAPTPLAHGGPLRLIVPGYTGVNNIKYVRRVAFTAVESDAKIMSHGYRLSPPGSQGDPSQPSVQEMSVKSWIDAPAPETSQVKAGAVRIQGIAFGGLSAVRRVEVSIDDGRSWSEARFVGPDLGKYAWRRFALDVTLPPGAYVLASRATDVAGHVQPKERLENAGGYNNTSWADHAVAVTVA